MHGRLVQVRDHRLRSMYESGFYRLCQTSGIAVGSLSAASALVKVLRFSLGSCEADVLQSRRACVNCMTKPTTLTPARPYKTKPAQETSATNPVTRGSRLKSAFVFKPLC